MSPTDEQALSFVLTGGSAAALMVPLVVSLLIWFVVVPLGLRGIFDALGTERSRAWIPFVNLATVYRLGGLSEFWLIALVIPVSSWLGAIMLFIASHRINRRLARSGWYTVLAVFAWWVWTLALGLQHRVDRTAAAEPMVWSAQRPPQAPLAIPPIDDSTPPVDEAPDPEQAAPARLAIPPQPARTPIQVQVAPPSVVPPQADSSAQPTNEDQAVDAVPAEASAPPAPHIDDDATIIRPVQGDATVISGGHGDATLISARRRPRWWVQTSMGARVELTGVSAILGRRPAAHLLYPGAQLIAVTDDALSVSATHAVLEFVGGDWQVTDLDSTNGVWLVDPDTSEETELGARNRARVTPQFMLGELAVKVVQGG